MYHLWACQGSSVVNEAEVTIGVELLCVENSGRKSLSCHFPTELLAVTETALV